MMLAICVPRSDPKKKSTPSVGLARGTMDRSDPVRLGELVYSAVSSHIPEWMRDFLLPESSGSSKRGLGSVLEVHRAERYLHPPW